MGLQVGERYRMVQQRHSPGALWLLSLAPAVPTQERGVANMGGFVNAMSHAHQMDCMCWQPELTGFVIAWVPGYQRVPHPVPDLQALHLGPQCILATVPVCVRGGVGHRGSRCPLVSARHSITQSAVLAVSGHQPLSWLEQGLTAMQHVKWSAPDWKVAG